MSLSDVKVLYAVSVLGLSMLLASPVIALLMPWPGGQRFSELWLLSEGHVADEQALTVTPDAVYRVFIGASNQMRRSEYYVVYVKIRNQTQPLSNVATSTASPLAALYEFRFILGDDAAWESPFTFALHNITVQDNVMHVRGVSMNQVRFPVVLQSAWDAENQGYYYQIFFELWRYDAASPGLQFHNRVVWIWLIISES
jgi:hypothetical protein